MDRPVMNPMFLDEVLPGGAGSRGRRESRWVRAARVAGRIGKLLLADVFRRRSEFRVEIGTPFSRFLRGLFYRMMFVPVVLAALVSILVGTATHPAVAPAVMDPTSQGVYYDPVDLLSLDHTKLEGWLIPVVDARRVIVEREDVLHKKHPAIVLVHDFGASRQQMLPLVVPLHDAGYVLLAINLRGAGGPSARVGSTFGLNEAQDVRAAVELLRRRPFVDEDAIGVLGVGTGATAALLAAEQDPRIKMLVLDHPVRDFEDVLAERIGPKQGWLGWVRPLCKWGFEIAYKVNAEDVDLSRFAGLMRGRPVLMLDDAGDAVSFVRPVTHRQIVDFVKRHLVSRPRHVTTLLEREGTMGLGRPAPRVLPGEDEWPRQRSAEEILRGHKGTAW